MKQSELDLILENHKKWLNGEDGGVKANFTGIDLSYCNFRDVDLSYAIFRDANLSYAELKGANFSNASLWATIGNRREIKTIQTESWQIVYTDTVIQIGCQRHNIDDWFSFNDKDIAAMDKDALKFWNKWKPILKLILEV